MENVLTIKDTKIKWPFKSIILLSLVTAVGFIPFESVFPIEIRNNILIWLTSGMMGFCGLFALIAVLLIKVMNYNKWFSGLAMLLSVFLLFPLALVIIIGSLMPTFDWRDQRIYRNGDDYVVIQTFNNFVTNSPMNPRLLRTKSPFGIIRVIEEQHSLGLNISKFDGNQTVYEGKIWNKIATTDK